MARCGDVGADTAPERGFMERRASLPTLLVTFGPSLLLLSVMLGGVLVPTPTWAGALKGTIRFVGASLGPKRVAVTTDQYVCGKEKDAEDLVVSRDRGIKNAVIWLQTPPPGARWEGSSVPVQTDQKECVFVPRVVVVPAGGTVEFLNNDRLLHNLHAASPRENPAFNRTQPKGRTIPIVFKRPEIIRVDCDLHPWMRAWVVVADHPFYALSNEQGEFSLPNVPAGHYTLQIWQESLGTVSRAVTVSDAPVTTVTVEMASK
jgi:plastocyanin